MRTALQNYNEIKLSLSRGCSTDWVFSTDWRCSTAWVAIWSATVRKATAASISECSQNTNDECKNYKQLHFDISSILFNPISTRRLYQLKNFFEKTVFIYKQSRVSVDDKLIFEEIPTKPI